MSSTIAAKKQANFLFRYALQSFAVILILAIFVRTFLVSSYVMSGWSMLPSVWPGDFLVAGKWKMTSIERGDVVILRCPQVKDRICLKRVVGLAGDRVEFRDGLLHVNGQAASYQNVAAEVQMELVSGQSWLIWPAPFTGKTGLTEGDPVVVPPDHLYLLNDKRSDREDSRAWGPVKSDLLEARALRVWLSLDWYEGDQVRSWPRVRWPRMLRSID
jgi:signal peptidase I